MILSHSLILNLEALINSVLPSDKAAKTVKAGPKSGDCAKSITQPLVLILRALRPLLSSIILPPKSIISDIIEVLSFIADKIYH